MSTVIKKNKTKQNPTEKIKRPKTGRGKLKLPHPLRVLVSHLLNGDDGPYFIQVLWRLNQIIICVIHTQR